MKFDWKICLATLAFGLMSACGGGGGGDSPATGGAPGMPAPSPVEYTDSVVALVGPGKMSGDLLEGEQLRTGITASVNMPSRDAVQAFANEKLYIVIEDPDSLFANPGQPAIVQTGPTAFNASLQMSLRQASKTGNYQGSLRVFVCLDSACSRQLQGSPLVVPYEINVYALKVDADSLALSTPFGTTTSRTITAELPNALVGFNAFLATGTTSSFPITATTTAVFSSTAPSAGTATATVTVTFPVKPGGVYGTYENSLVIRAIHRTPEGRDVELRKTIPIKQTVTKSEVLDYVLIPPQLRITHSQVPGLALDSGLFGILTNEGATATWFPPEYLSAPAAAAGHPLLHEWISNYNSSVIPCYGGPNAVCLPPGIYTARQPWQVTRNGTSYTVYLPITLEMTQ